MRFALLIYSQLMSLELAPNLFGFFKVSLIQEVIGHLKLMLPAFSLAAMLGVPLLLLLIFLADALEM